MEKQEVKTDILGNRSTVRKLKITRRQTVPDGETRLTVLEKLEALADWARQNPPEGGQTKMTGLPEFSSRSAAGTEDLSITLTVETEI